MVGIYIAVALSGVLMTVVFVDRLPSYLMKQESAGRIKDSIEKLLFATIKHLRHKEQLLLIPITMYSGFEQGFLNAEFFKVEIVDFGCRTLPKSPDILLYSSAAGQKTSFLIQCVLPASLFSVFCHLFYWHLECWLCEHPVWDDERFHCIHLWIPLQVHWKDSYIFSRCVHREKT